MKITKFDIDVHFCYFFFMNVSLTPRLDGFVDQQVTSGRYKSASEVVREALRLLEIKEQENAIMQRKLDEGFASESLDGPQAMEELRRKYNF